MIPYKWPKINGFSWGYFTLPSVAYLLTLGRSILKLLDLGNSSQFFGDWNPGMPPFSAMKNSWILGPFCSPAFLPQSFPNQVLGVFGSPPQKSIGLKTKSMNIKRCCCRTEQTTRYVVITVLAVLNVVTGVNLGTNLLGRHPAMPHEVVWCLIGVHLGGVEKISPSKALKRYHTHPSLVYYPT